MPIMYVDDDEDDQAIFKNAITSLGITRRIISFWNGAEALDYLQSHKIRPFIIFCDINMPKMDGLQLRKKISENKQLALNSVPFIFYSTNADEGFVNMAYELTVQGYFKKPSDNGEIK